MLGERIKRRITDLRQQPEHVRLQVATRYTIIAGIILVIIWLVVFLPLQIRSALRNSNQPATPSPVLTPVP